MTTLSIWRVFIQLKVLNYCCVWFCGTFLILRGVIFADEGQSGESVNTKIYKAQFMRFIRGLLNRKKSFKVSTQWVDQATYALSGVGSIMFPTFQAGGEVIITKTLCLLSRQEQANTNDNFMAINNMLMILKKRVQIIVYLFIAS